MNTPQRLTPAVSRPDFKIELMVVFAILVSLGFPGSFTTVYGNTLGTVLEYGAFFLELLAILFSSGDSWLDIHLLDLDQRYYPLYLFVLVIFVESMLVTRYPSEELVSCLRLSMTLYFAIWLQERFDFQRMVELIGFAQGIFVFFCLVFIIRYPSLAYESGDSFHRALKGLYFTKNSFASELSMGILVSAYLAKNKLKTPREAAGWLALLAVQTLMILLCQATGPLLCTILALLFLFVPDLFRLPWGLGYIAGNIVFLFGTLTLMPYLAWIFEALGKDATLTGRIPLWRGVIDMMSNHNTLTGFGYAMFWRDSRATYLLHRQFDSWSSLGSISTGAHNVLLELWLNIGLLGLAAFFLMLAYAFRRPAELPAQKYSFSAILMAYFLLNGLTERCFGGTYDYKMLLLFVVAAACCNRPQSAASGLFGRKTTQET